MKYLCKLFAAMLLSMEVVAEAVPVRIIASDSGYELQRGGQPYTIRGAGVDGGSLEALAAAGGNSLRTWSTDNAAELLDRAQDLGLTVALCLDIGRERLGFDYNDAAAVAAQLAQMREEVRRYKDHPALLFWMIGNEPNLHYTNPRVFDAINDISKMIHELDGAHPTTTALAGFDVSLGREIDERAPDLDFLSIQMYGDIPLLPRRLDEANFSRAVVVTEWGATGHWEVAKTSWGAPIETDSGAKADNYLQRFRSVIDANQDRILGSYVFLWGQKQERTPTWYGMFLADGSATEAVDVMQYLWTGQWPALRSPRVEGLALAGGSAGDNIMLAPGARYPAELVLGHAENTALTFRWEVMQESTANQEGGDLEQIPAVLSGLVEGDRGAATLTAPREPGYYRLFAYVYGPGGRAGHANIPFSVEH